MAAWLQDAHEFQSTFYEPVPLKRSLTLFWCTELLSTFVKNVRYHMDAFYVAIVAFRYIPTIVPMVTISNDATMLMRELEARVMSH